jgi:hypothetical protein
MNLINQLDIMISAATQDIGMSLLSDCTQFDCTYTAEGLFSVPVVNYCRQSLAAGNQGWK